MTTTMMMTTTTMMMTTIATDRHRRARLHARVVLLVAAVSAVAAVASGCREQRLAAKASWVEAAMKLDESRMARFTPPVPGAAFVENFRDPQNVVEAFLRAAEAHDAVAMARAVHPEFRLQGLIDGTVWRPRDPDEPETDDDFVMPLLPGVSPINYGTPADELKMMTADSWRWSALSFRIWRFAGIGPAVTIVENQVLVSLVPGVDQDYHLVFKLERADETKPWAIRQVLTSYEFDAADGVARRYTRDIVPDSLLPASLDDPVELCRGVLDKSACEAMVPPNVRDWVITFPELRAEARKPQEWRTAFLARLAPYWSLDSDTTYEGAYVERTFHLPEATATQSCFCVVRMLFSTSNPEAPFKRWSVRVQLRSTVENGWWLVCIDDLAKGKRAWPAHAEKLRRAPRND